MYMFVYTRAQQIHIKTGCSAVVASMCVCAAGVVSVCLSVSRCNRVVCVDVQACLIFVLSTKTVLECKSYQRSTTLMTVEPFDVDLLVFPCLFSPRSVSHVSARFVSVRDEMMHGAW